MALHGLSQANIASRNLMSDLRGMGDMLLFIGAFVLTSSFNKS